MHASSTQLLQLHTQPTYPECAEAGEAASDESSLLMHCKFSLVIIIIIIVHSSCIYTACCGIYTACCGLF